MGLVEPTLTWSTRYGPVARFAIDGENVRAPRICAYIWGNDGEYHFQPARVPTWSKFQSKLPDERRRYEGHHLPVRCGTSWVYHTDRAFPGEVVVVHEQRHKELHSVRAKWAKPKKKVGPYGQHAGGVSTYDVPWEYHGTSLSTGRYYY